MFNQVETMEYAGHLSLSCNFILLRIVFYRSTVRLSLFPVSLKFSRDKKLGKLSYNAQKFLVRICNIPINYEIGFMWGPFDRILCSCAFCFSCTASIYVNWYQSPIISSYYLLCAIILCYFVCCELLNNHGWKRSQSKHVQKKKKKDSSRERNFQELMTKDMHRQIMELKRGIRVIQDMWG